MANSKENITPVDIKQAALSGEVILATKKGMLMLDEKIIETQKKFKEVVKKMGESANGDRDLRENKEFMELRNMAQIDLPKKIRALEDQRKKTVEFVADETSGDKIIFGSKFVADVYYPGETEPERETYQLLGPLEQSFSDTSNSDVQILSYLSPMGKALWGKSSNEGSTNEFGLPNGKARCLIVHTL